MAKSIEDLDAEMLTGLTGDTGFMTAAQKQAENERLARKGQTFYPDLPNGKEGKPVKIK